MTNMQNELAQNNDYSIENLNRAKICGKLKEVKE